MCQALCWAQTERSECGASSLEKETKWQKEMHPSVLHDRTVSVRNRMLRGRRKGVERRTCFRSGVSTFWLPWAKRNSKKKNCLGPHNLDLKVTLKITSVFYWIDIRSSEEGDRSIEEMSLNKL